MAIVARCPDCGKRLRVPDQQAGVETVCAACGFPFQLPPAPVTAEVTPAAGLGAGEPIPNPAGQFKLRVAVIVAVILFLAAGGWFGFDIARQFRLAKDRAIARNFDDTARALVASGKTADARIEYKQLADFLAPRAADDPLLKKLAGDVNQTLARLDREALLESTPAGVVGIAKTASPATVPDAEPVVRLDPPPAQKSAATQPDLRVASVPPVSSQLHTPPGPLPVQPPMPTTRPAVHAIVDVAPRVNDEAVGRAIQRGVDSLIREFDPNTSELRGRVVMFNNRRAPRDGYENGADVLSVYALLQSSEAINDPRLSMHGSFLPPCVEVIKLLPLNDRFATYSRGLRATALAHLNRKEDNKVLREDVAALRRTVNKGAYTYFDMIADGGREGNWDNSNSQYGLLGVWSGAEAEIEVPTSYWTDVERHWISCQLPGGQWGYDGARSQPRLTMTCAGVASLFVCHDWLDGARFGAAVGREPFSPALKKGLDWLEDGDHLLEPSSHWGYGLYGVERAGLASGFKFFGKHEWYPELASDVLAHQSPSGEWFNTVDTAYALLFLSRGRHPILMNKLRYDGYWANRPRDIANLATFASRELERPVNWQVVPLNAQWTDWTDSPILYLASHVPPKLSDADVVKMRQYIQAGGMLFVQADGDAPLMGGFARELGNRLFPMYEMTDVPAGHPLFNSLYKLPQHPPLKMVTNGARILMLFSPTDISKHWQLREQNTPTGKPFFQLGINMFVYAAGRRDLRNKLDSNILAPIAGASSMTVKVARVKYAGNWDPEPYAWMRFTRWFHQQTGYGVDVEPVEMRNLDASLYPFAHLTGTAPYRAAADEIAAVKKYVSDGGVLLIDLAGGTGQFDESVRSSLLAGAFPGIYSREILPNHPLLQPGNSGMDDLMHVRLRPYVIEKFGTGGGTLDSLKVGRGHVIYTSLDVTSGLLNTGTWGILGYEPAYAQNLLKNAIFWTLDGQKDN